MSVEEPRDWGFYALDEDRSWDWSNHVWSLGWICHGYGKDPADAWAEALQTGRVPEEFLNERRAPDVVIPAAQEFSFAIAVEHGVESR